MCILTSDEIGNNKEIAMMEETHEAREFGYVCMAIVRGPQTRVLAGSPIFPRLMEMGQSGKTIKLD